ncbi:uncharacterized protein BDZ99DRAFT_514176 [Mytilinidion resinicola]|uniref:RING-type domain-containing protein n=1 Tax=Mytilinidion resinicola TaxID=574789 RepID=A0A6A6ZCC0_9PEZI|nr:uncharacterized protein BDZ99DRAFT_514176 [Mytilinidion resinicola]KAF2817955.1 hypothetical protein BDZ99DRAFT_514176 [Mytilinidion resinicola]
MNTVDGNSPGITASSAEGEDAKPPHQPPHSVAPGELDYSTHCLFCAEELDDEGPDPLITTSCGHRFGASCLTKFMASDFAGNHVRCPICRTNFKLGEVLGIALPRVVSYTSVGIT